MNAAQQERSTVPLDAGRDSKFQNYTADHDKEFLADWFFFFKGAGSFSPKAANPRENH
jgi:hypothetical protein